MDQWDVDNVMNAWRKQSILTNCGDQERPSLPGGRALQACRLGGLVYVSAAQAVKTRDHNTDRKNHKQFRIINRLT